MLGFCTVRCACENVAVSLLQVKEVCGTLRSEAGKEYSSEVKRFTQEVATINEQIEKLKVGAARIPHTRTILTPTPTIYN